MKIAMAANQPGKGVESKAGPGITNALRGGLAPGMLIVDGRKNLATLAGGAAEILGLKAPQKSRVAVNVLPQALQAIIGQVSLSGELVEARAVPLAIEGRGRIRVDVSAVPLEPGKRNSGVAVCLADVGQTGVVGEQLLRLNRLATVGTFSAGVAHEIRNALVAGKTFIDLQAEKNPDAELDAVVRREMGRIDALLSGMLKYAGPAKPALAPVRLHEVLEHSLRLIEPRMHEKSIALSRSFRAAPDMVKADGLQLQQAFVNLFLNALEAMGPNGALSVATESARTDPAPARARREDVLVTIKDTGPGISPENMKRLFEPFFTTKEEGTGLGLAITKHIIEEHYGTIRAESGPSNGAVFKIVLPGSTAAA
jgi:signal transduction histidine kinase